MKKLVLAADYKYIAAFLTMRCNLNCSYCLNAFDKSFDRKGFKEISGKQWVDGLNRIESSNNLPVTFCGGEPFLHKDFFYIINNVKPELAVDILTNLQWGKSGIERFIAEVNPDRLRRESKFPSIRVSYHPEQMSSSQELVDKVKRLKKAGFNIGIESVMYPGMEQLAAIEAMWINCDNEGIRFRPKSFTGVYSGRDDCGREFSIIHGNYSKYNSSAFQKETKECECRTSEIIIGPDARVYRCHRDLFAEENSIGSILSENFCINNEFRPCKKYGQCHPCDVKNKTNSKQQLGHTSVEIRNIK